MKTTLWASAAVASLCVASAAFGADMTQPDPMAQPAPTLDVKQLPGAVQATLDREGGRVNQVHEKTENGMKFYETSVSKDGKNYMLHINSDGTIVTREPAAQ